MTLKQAKPGSYQLTRIQSNSNTRQRLATLGIRPKRALDVILMTKTGAILSVQGARLALGHELLGQLEVEPVNA